MRINTNMAALNAWRALTINNESMTKSLEKLSSGYRVNRAADDAAGLAVSEKMRAQIRGLNMAIRNAQDGISLIQTAEGGATQIQNMVQRMRELAVQAANGTLTEEDRGQLQKEFAQLQEEVSRTAATTKFNELGLLGVAPASAKANASLSTYGVKVTVSEPAVVTGKTYVVTYDDDNDQLVISDGTDIERVDVGTKTTLASLGITVDATDFALPDPDNPPADGDQLGTIETVKQGAWSNEITLQIGVGADETVDVLKITMEALDATSLKIDEISIDDDVEARNAISVLDGALETISGVRANLGSYQNRLENSIATLRIQSENLTAAESRIRDVDMALEMATFTKYQILQQASTAMLAQANMSTQSILSLLR